MKLLKLVGLAAIFISFAGSQSVMAADGEGITTTFGIRGWSAEWAGNSGGGRAPISGGGSVDVIGDAKSKATTAIIPFISVRYGDFGVSGSTMLHKTFTLEGSNGSLTPNRQEWDLNGSYYFAPNVSASIGYKKITWPGVVSKGPIVAASASAPLIGDFGMYGTAVYGWLKSDVDSPGFTKGAKTAYNLLEGGLTYSFGPMIGLKGTALTLGYRVQRIKAKNLWPISSTNGPTTYSDTIDLMSGPILGFVASF